MWWQVFNAWSQILWLFWEKVSHFKQCSIRWMHRTNKAAIKKCVEKARCCNVIHSSLSSKKQFVGRGFTGMSSRCRFEMPSEQWAQVFGRPLPWSVPEERPSAALSYGAIGNTRCSAGDSAEFLSTTAPTGKVVVCVIKDSNWMI